jgi:hypothetical protein
VKSCAGQLFAGGLFLEFGIVTWLVQGILRQDQVLAFSDGTGIVLEFGYVATIDHHSWPAERID